MSPLHRGLDGPLATGLSLEADAFAQAWQTEDARVGIRTFFEKGPGKAAFGGR